MTESSSAVSPCVCDGPGRLPEWRARPTSVAAQQKGVGTIAGVAADSLHIRPLAGALVSVVGVGRSAVTDDDGAFRIDSVPAGAVRLTVFHPLLDTLAISLLTQPLTVIADSTLNVVVRVPSTVSILRLKCGSDTGSVVPLQGRGWRCRVLSGRRPTPRGHLP